MSFSQFKSIDLLIFSIITIIFEVINRFAFIKFTNFQLVFMSFTIVLTLISMYRWGFAGLIVAFFGKLIAVVISTHNNDYRYYVSYIFGTLIAILIGYIIFQKIIGKKRIKKIYLIIPYLLFDFSLAIIFISLFFSLFGVDTFINGMKGLFIQESMSIFFSIIILLIANRKNGNILIDMKGFVKDVHELKKLGGLKEMKESPKFNDDRPFTEMGQIDYSNILDGGTMNVDQLKELEQMYKESDNIKLEDPIECLSKREKKEDKCSK